MASRFLKGVGWLVLLVALLLLAGGPHWGGLSGLAVTWAARVGVAVIVIFGYQALAYGSSPENTDSEAGRRQRE